MSDILYELLPNVCNNLQVIKSGGNNKTLICKTEAKWEDTIHLSIFDGTKYSTGDNLLLTIDSGKDINQEKLSIIEDKKNEFINLGFSFDKFGSGYKLYSFNQTINDDVKHKIINAINILCSIYNRDDKNV